MTKLIFWIYLYIYIIAAADVAKTLDIQGCNYKVLFKVFSCFLSQKSKLRWPIKLSLVNNMFRSLFYETCKTDDLSEPPFCWQILHIYMLNFLTEPGLVMLVMIKEGDYGLLFIILMIYTNQNFTMYDPLCELSPSVVKCILTFLTMCALRHARLLRMAGDQPHTKDVY